MKNDIIIIKGNKTPRLTFLEFILWGCVILLPLSLLTVLVLILSTDLIPYYYLYPVGILLLCAIWLDVQIFRPDEPEIQNKRKRKINNHD